MFKIGYDKKITMVQGDTGVIRMRIRNYELSQGDEVRFAIVNKANPSILLCQHSDKKIVLEKQVTVFEKDGSARIVIYPYDTEYLQPGKYLYEIQVKTKDGRVDTVVPLTSFTMMDGSIQGEYGQTTPSKPEPTPSEIELRFKRLENEIIPELGNRITNVENEIDSINSSLEHITFYKSPQMFGAKGDGATDDTKAIQDCMNYCYDNKKTMFVPKATYIIRDIINIPSIKIIGDNAIFKINEQKTTREHTFVANKSTFEIYGLTILSNCNCSSLGLFNCEDVTIKKCKFEVPLGFQCNGYVDLYTGNKNILVENCIFNCLTNSSVGGGVWVRSVYEGSVSNNITFNKCVFNHNTVDEALCPYAGKGGTLTNVYINNCEFNIYNETNIPRYVVTVGNTGFTKDVIISNCKFNCEKVHLSVIDTKINPNDDTAFTENVLIENCFINAKNQENTAYSIFYSSNSGLMKIKNCIIELDNTFTKRIGINCDFEGCKSNSYSVGFSNCNVINCEHTQVGGQVFMDGAIIKDNILHLTTPNILYLRSLTNKEHVIIRNNVISSDALFSGDGIYSNNKTDVTYEVASNTGIGRVVINGSTSLVHDNIMDFTQSSQSATQFYNNIIKGVFKATGGI